MKKLLLSLFIFLALPNLVFGAVAYDNSTRFGSRSSPGSSQSGSLTVSGTDTMVAACVMTVDTNNRLVDSLTVGGVAATKAYGPFATGGSRYFWLYYIYDVPAGSQTVQVNMSGSVAFDLFVTAASYTGVANTLQATSSGFSSVATSHTQSLTTTEANSLVVGCGVAGNNTALSGGTGLTQRQTLNGIAGGADAGVSIGDSNGPVASAGSYSMTVTTSPADNELGLIMAAFSPAADPVVPRFGDFFLFE